MAAQTVDAVASALIGLSERLQVIESAASMVATACEGDDDEHVWRVLRHSVCLRLRQEREALDALRASLADAG